MHVTNRAKFESYISNSYYTLQLFSFNPVLRNSETVQQKFKNIIETLHLHMAGANNFCIAA